MTLFPAFDDEWVLHRGDGLLVLDKPAHVPSQAPDGQGDDLPTRAKKHLGLEYIGTHQRLDAATSGVVAYTTDAERNRGFAEALTSATKQYIAIVHSFSGRGGRLEHWLAPRPGGGSVVTSDSDSRAKRAVTHVEVLRRQGERTLLRLRIETGRTHQIRVQLAEVGSPIAGDTLYGDPAETPGRLMLHAEALDVGGKSFVAPVPASFETFLQDKPNNLARLVRVAAQRRFVLAHSSDTTAFRLFHGEAEGAPGISIDVYGRHLLLHLRSEEAHAQEAEIVDALRAFSGEFRGLYVKRRPKQANEQSGDKRELAPPHPLWGEGIGAFEVLESGLRYGVDLSQGLSTGIFLDQRRARSRVRERSKGARVLNLFAYTCPFGIAAAAGGAKEVINVDSSAKALGRGKANFERNHLSGRVLKNDAFEYLERCVRKGELFDWVLCDPPTYATGKKRRWKSGPQWRQLAALCARVTSPEGRLLLSSNDSRMSQSRFRRYVREGVESTGRELSALRDGKSARDFPVAPGGEPLPRRLWLELGPS